MHSFRKALSRKKNNIKEILKHAEEILIKETVYLTVVISSGIEDDSIFTECEIEQIANKRIQQEFPTEEKNKQLSEKLALVLISRFNIKDCVVCSIVYIIEVMKFLEKCIHHKSTSVSSKDKQILTQGLCTILCRQFVVLVQHHESIHKSYPHLCAEKDSLLSLRFIDRQLEKLFKAHHR